MIVAIFGLYNDCIDVGISGSPLPQTSVPSAYLSDPFSLTQSLHNAISHLLVSPRGITAIIVEPPLFSIELKQAIADFLLSHCKVNSIGFLQRSVCLIAGLGDQDGAIEPGVGLILDELENIIIPVYDYRELTSCIRDCTECDWEMGLALITDNLAIDLRKPIMKNVQNYEETSAQKLLIWQGASALTSRRKVWPLLSREQHRKGFKVWDSLFDMR